MEKGCCLQHNGIDLPEELRECRNIDEMEKQGPCYGEAVFGTDTGETKYGLGRKLIRINKAQSSDETMKRFRQLNGLHLNPTDCSKHQAL
jgi:hypothetical protein